MRVTALGLVVLSSLSAGCHGVTTEASSSSSSEAETDTAWCHASLRATDGTSVAIDYRASGSFTHGNRFFGLDPVWFNVHREGLVASDAVRLVFVDLDQETVESSQTIDLELAEAGRFTGQARGVLSAIYRHQHVAVSINGAWLEDPISASTTFTTDLAGDGGGTVTQCGVMW